MKKGLSPFFYAPHLLAARMLGLQGLTYYFATSSLA